SRGLSRLRYVFCTPRLLFSELRKFVLIINRIVNFSAKAQSPINQLIAGIHHEIQGMEQNVQAILVAKLASLRIYSFPALSYPVLLLADLFYFFQWATCLFSHESYEEYP